MHTRPRQEKIVAQILSRKQVAHFLPLSRAPRKYGNRETTVSLPLFPGYLFVCGDWNAREAAWRTNRVATILDAPDQDGLRAELGLVYRLVTSGERIGLAKLVRGTRCRVVAGPLRGLEGTVLNQLSRCRIYVAMTMLNRSVTVEIDDACLEPAS